jgi:hypothetical protein
MTVNTLSYRSYTGCTNSVAGETFVHLVHCIAVDLFLGIADGCLVSTVEHIRYHGYIFSPLGRDGSILLGIWLPRQPVTVCCIKTRVEAGSKTSTVIMRVVRGDKMGLKKAAP